MVLSQLPYLNLVSSDPVSGAMTLALVSNGTTARYFSSSDGLTFTGSHYTQETLTQNTADREFILTDTTGRRLRFHNFSSALPNPVPLAQQGEFKSFTDPYGTVLTAARDANGKLTEVTRATGSGSAKVTESYLYTFTSTGQVLSVELR